MTKKKFAVVLFAIVAFFTLIWGEWRYMQSGYSENNHKIQSINWVSFYAAKSESGLGS